MLHALVVDEATTSPKLCMSSQGVPLRDYFTIYTPIKFLKCWYPTFCRSGPILGNDIYSRIVLLWTNLGKQIAGQFHRKNKRTGKNIHLQDPTTVDSCPAQLAKMYCYQIKIRWQKKTWALSLSADLHNQWFPQIAINWWSVSPINLPWASTGHERTPFSKRIIPVSMWLITMVIVFVPNSWGCGIQMAIFAGM